MKLLSINFPFWSVTTAFRPLGISENGQNIDLYHDLGVSQISKTDYFKVLKIIEDILIGFWFYKPVNRGSFDYESYTLAHSHFFKDSNNHKKIYEFIKFLVSKYEIDWSIELKNGISEIDYYISPVNKIYRLLWDISTTDFDEGKEKTDFIISRLKRLLKMLTFQDNKLYLRFSTEPKQSKKIEENDFKQDSGEI